MVFAPAQSKLPPKPGSEDLLFHQPGLELPTAYLNAPKPQKLSGVRTSLLGCGNEAATTHY